MYGYICTHKTRLQARQIRRIFTLKGSKTRQEWLRPVTATFEQSLRDEDMELVTKHLLARGTI